MGLSISERLRELGVTLPEPPAAVAAYVPAVVEGDHVWTSGQLPFVNGQLLVRGRVGDAVSLEDGYQAARQAAVNALAAAAARAGGVDRLAGVVKVVGFVQSGPDFHDQPRVINGASELLESVFGEAGRHARSAVGVSALPLDAPVEVEVVFRLAAPA
jgi:enamine deaminase RidA (YjgF/YER057c/UK114 family)